ncbi:MAG: 2-amino-4-hydroxy-6-hydroxymethyldihydropteridine diphosphokinase [Aestuariivita sp.]|nr:2-amino-4-hydroxy-6-hydroxymethyldihydropteridine diphosphokinase [Aestuariivita sp.]
MDKAQFMPCDHSEMLVALGANLSEPDGAPESNLVRALQELVTQGIELRSVSRFFRTPCVPKGAGPSYINAAIVIGARETPDKVLGKLHQTEAVMGRQRHERWGNRTLDLDLIAAGSSIWPDRHTYLLWRELTLEEQRVRAPQQLVLPHPRMENRAFVLIPLLDIAPEWRHPLSGKTVRDMVDDLPEDALCDISSV